MTDDYWMSPAAIEDELGIPQKTVMRFVDAGMIPIDPHESQTWIRRSDMDAFLEHKAELEEA